MKKTISILAIVLMTVVGFQSIAQKDTTLNKVLNTPAKTANSNPWHFYVSPGVSYCQGAAGYGLETGIYDNHFWIALTNETYTVNPFVMLTGVRGYYNFLTAKSFYFYANAAVKFVDQKNGPMILEPGAALVFQPSSWKHLALQLGGSEPYSQGSFCTSGCFCVNFLF